MVGAISHGFLIGGLEDATQAARRVSVLEDGTHYMQVTQEEISKMKTVAKNLKADLDEVAQTITLSDGKVIKYGVNAADKPAIRTGIEAIEQASTDVEHAEDAISQTINDAKKGKTAGVGERAVSEASKAGTEIKVPEISEATRAKYSSGEQRPLTEVYQMTDEERIAYLESRIGKFTEQEKEAILYAHYNLETVAEKARYLKNNGIGDIERDVILSEGIAGKEVVGRVKNINYGTAIDDLAKQTSLPTSSAEFKELVTQEASEAGKSLVSELNARKFGYESSQSGYTYRTVKNEYGELIEVESKLYPDVKYYYRIEKNGNLVEIGISNAGVTTYAIPPDHIIESITDRTKSTLRIGNQDRETYYKHTGEYKKVMDGGTPTQSTYTLQDNYGNIDLDRIKNLEKEATSYAFSEGYLDNELLSGRNSGELNFDLSNRIGKNEYLGISANTRNQVKTLTIKWEVLTDPLGNKYLLIHGFPNENIKNPIVLLKK